MSSLSLLTSVPLDNLSTINRQSNGEQHPFLTHQAEQNYEILIFWLPNMTDEGWVRDYIDIIFRGHHTWCIRNNGTKKVHAHVQ